MTCRSLFASTAPPGRRDAPPPDRRRAWRSGAATHRRGSDPSAPARSAVDVGVSNCARIRALELAITRPIASEVLGCVEADGTSSRPSPRRSRCPENADAGCAALLGTTTPPARVPRTRAHVRLVRVAVHEGADRSRPWPGSAPTRGPITTFQYAAMPSAKISRPWQEGSRPGVVHRGRSRTGIGPVRRHVSG